MAPLGANRDQLVTVTIELDAPSVAEATADAGGDLTSGEEASTRALSDGQQDSLVTLLDSLGGQVLYQLQDAERRGRTRSRSAVPRLQAARHVTAVSQASLLEPAVSRPSNAVADVLTKVAPAWEALGTTGAGMSIGIIDTGIDYTHADFGGSGNPDDFAANDSTVIEDGTFPTAKVLGGFDYVGDAYDAGSDDPAALVPVPDPDPLDCQGHGTHVAGTAAGTGVTADGSTYTGPYDAAALDTLAIGPGSAPEASLYAYRVFGCDGIGRGCHRRRRGRPGRAGRGRCHQPVARQPVRRRQGLRSPGRSTTPRSPG
ncbi:MAG: S8 family serine peptidase [Ilumatobacteraceae bacterium]